MSDLGEDLREQYLNLNFTGVVYVALYTTNADGDIVEMGGISYSRKAITLVADGVGVRRSDTDLSFTKLTSPVTHVGLLDEPTGGTLLARRKLETPASAFFTPITIEKDDLSVRME